MDFDRYKCLSFDCYGTLIDWETGLLSALRSILDKHQVEVGDRELLESYAEAEAFVEAAGFRPNRQVLCEVLLRLGATLEFSPSSDELEEFSVSVKRWPAFDDSSEALRALQTKYKLIILSNIDDELFEHSARILGIDFDAVFTAQQIGETGTAVAHLIGEGSVFEHEIDQFSNALSRLELHVLIDVRDKLIPFLLHFRL